MSNTKLMDRIQMRTRNMIMALEDDLVFAALDNLADIFFCPLCNKTVGKKDHFEEMTDHDHQVLEIMNS